MASVVYGLCALTAVLCAWLLLQAYRDGGYRLLLWAGLCFAGLAVNNVLLVLDKVIWTTGDLSLARSSVALLAMGVLIYGLVVDAE